jgi:hypothetical protein
MPPAASIDEDHESVILDAVALVCMKLSGMEGVLSTYEAIVASAGDEMGLPSVPSLVSWD